MAAGYQELFIEQGVDFSTSITLDNPDNEPFDLTGFEAKSQIRKSYYSNNAAAQFTINIGTPANGTISMALSSSNTANLASGRYVYDVVIRKNNQITRVLEGIVNIVPQVTKF
jgi:hypothetical protein